MTYTTVGDGLTVRVLTIVRSDPARVWRASEIVREVDAPTIDVIQAIRSLTHDGHLERIDSGRYLAPSPG